MTLGPGPSFPFSLLHFTPISHSSHVPGKAVPWGSGYQEQGGLPMGLAGQAAGLCPESPSPGTCPLTHRDQLSPQGQDWGPDERVHGQVQV